MAYTKQNFTDGQVLTGAQLNHIEDGIVQNENNIISIENNIASTNSNVTSIGNRVTSVENSKIEMKLLWANASTGSDFAAQSLTLSLSDYSGVIITYPHYKGQGCIRSVFIAMGTEGCMQSINGLEGQTGAVQNGIRYVTVNTSSIKFNGGNYAQAGGSFSANNGICVPYRIYGVKGAK